MPVFIKNLKQDKATGSTDRPDYKEQWFKFLKRRSDAAFLINPKPKFTSDIILQGDKLRRLFEDNIMPATAEFELGSNAVYALGSKYTLTTLSFILILMRLHYCLLMVFR